MDLDKFKLLHNKYHNTGLQANEYLSPEFDEYIDALHNDKSCSDWYKTFILEERGFDFSKHCCLTMSLHISEPNTMPDGEDDHDIIMKYNDMFDEYGIPVYDGGTSIIQIDFCPWCGTKLPASKRDRWFEELGEQAFEDPDHIPEKYKSDLWWRNLIGPITREP